MNTNSLDRKALDYDITPKDANELLGAVLLPYEFRMMLMEKYLKDHGPSALANLFAQFIGMANSVIENNRDSLELFLVCEKNWLPYEAEKMNLPTIFGALNGIKLAEGIDQSKTCHGCACRIGTLANQSPSTTCDVEWCLQGDDRFWCHEDLDEKGNPTKRCIGFQTHLKNREAA